MTRCPECVTALHCKAAGRCLQYITPSEYLEQVAAEVTRLEFEREQARIHARVAMHEEENGKRTIANLEQRLQQQPVAWDCAHCHHPETSHHNWRCGGLEGVGSCGCHRYCHPDIPPPPDTPYPGSAAP